MNVAFKEKFYFHHSSPNGEYVLMAKWTDESCENRLPGYPDHYIGVGGLVIN
jgi:hypothetical protein